MRFRLPPWTRRAVWLWLLGANVARAHNPLSLSSDPFGGLVVAELRPNSLELRVTMVRAVGLALAANTGLSSNSSALPSDALPTFVVGMNTLPPAPVNPDGSPAADAEFEQARPILQQRARDGDIYQVSSAGSALKPSQVEVTLTTDRDILFHYSYPRPASDSLLFEGVYLIRMPANHIDSIEVFDQSGQSLASAGLTPLNPSLRVTLPVATSSFEKFAHIVLAGLVLVVVIYGLRRISRPSPGEPS